MAVSKQFDKRVPLDSPRRSHGVRRRFRGCTVAPNGLPRAENASALAGGNAPRHWKDRGRKHGIWRGGYWERNGERAAPPRGWLRGWLVP